MRPAWHVVAMPPPAARCMLLDAPRGTAPPPPVNLHGEACGSMPRPLHAPRFPPPPGTAPLLPMHHHGGDAVAMLRPLHACAVDDPQRPSPSSSREPWPLNPAVNTSMHGPHRWCGGG